MTIVLYYNDAQNYIKSLVGMTKGNNGNIQDLSFEYDKANMKDKLKCYVETNLWMCESISDYGRMSEW